MKISGKVVKVLAPVRGTSARGEWVKQEVIFEQPDDFGRKLCIAFWADKAAEAASLREGEQCEVSVNLESREFNGRWYTEARAWQLVRTTPAAAAPAMEEAPFPMPDDAPFDEEPF